MADLIVKRGINKRDLLRRYAIEIDGTCVGHIRAGGTTHIAIAEGMRTIRLSIDGYGSKAKTILSSNRCVAILNCAPADLPVSAYPSQTSRIRVATHLPLDRTAYIEIGLERADDLARAFLQTAWSVARHQIQERTKPGERSRYGLTAGDLSVLYHGCRIPDADLVTAARSANACLWKELAQIGWLIPAASKMSLAKTVTYRLTPMGQIELLEIFSN